MGAVSVFMDVTSSSVIQASQLLCVRQDSQLLCVRQA